MSKKETRATTILEMQKTELHETMEVATLADFSRENDCIDRDVERLKQFEEENHVVFIAVNANGLAGVLATHELLHTGGNNINYAQTRDELIQAVEIMLRLR